MIAAAGFAVADPEIMVKTVSETRRAAIVNWLVVERGVVILALTSDEEIESLWKRAAMGAHVVAVTISPVQH